MSFKMTTIQSICESKPMATKVVISSGTMSGGNGDASYAKNSQVQGQMLDSCESMLYGAFRELRNIPAPAPGVPALRLADLGCATGRNTLNAVTSILDMVKLRYQLENVEMPEVEVFFADLPSNDFNTLFQELPPLYHGAGGSDSSLKDFSRDSAERIYHARGVPGSFFKEKLFPAKSMHVITSFTALHWLSELPSPITDKTSDAYNKNRVWLDGTSGAVRAVIAQQAAADLKKFLHFRAEELVPGGVLVLMFFGRLDRDRVRSGRGDRADGIQEYQGLNETGHLLLQTFQELVSEGVIDQEKLDTFNIPTYSRSVEEVRSAVEESGQFDIHLLDNFVSPDMPLEEKKRIWPTPEAFARSSANRARGVTHGLFLSHIGAELSDLFFHRLEVNAIKIYPPDNNYGRMCSNVAILIRRP